MGAQVSFDYENWITRYPEFSNVVATLAQMYFSEATMFCPNDGSGPIDDPGQQTIVLNLLTAHIAKMNAQLGDCESEQSVGRINSATESSVTVQLQYDVPAGTPQWYAQTKYGAQAWTAMAAAGMHSMIYVSGHPRPMWP